MRLVLALTLLPFLSIAQHKSVSYELTNEVGTYKLLSLTLSHDLDNMEGITYVVDARQGDTLYHLNHFLSGWVALSNDGKTIAHLLSEKDKEPLENSILTMYRNGRQSESAALERLVNYELQAAVASNRLPKSGWLRNDSIYHKMAENPFYVTEDKLYISFETPKLTVFNLNQMVHIYTGNGANHFNQNYFSIPNPPLRKYMDGDEFFPEGFPTTTKGKSIGDLVTEGLGKKAAIPEMARLRAEISLKLNSDGSFELRNASVHNIKDNKPSEELTEQLNKLIDKTTFDTSLIPPNHPAWMFETILWLN